MSSDWWVNQIGSSAAATTPTGGIPQYALATDLGTAPWQNAYTFKTFVEDQASATHAVDAEAADIAAEAADVSYFNQAMGAIGGFLSNAFGSIQRSGRELAGEDIPDDPDLDRVEENQQLASEGLSNITQSPGVDKALMALDTGLQAISTPFILDRNTQMEGGPGGPKLSMWWDKSAWAAAWREADERTPGQALVESVISGDDTTTEDLDRIRRTNSLYGLSSFATDLALGFKFDPTVLGAKAIGETRAISKGLLPRGQASGTARAEAERVLRGNTPYNGLNPAGRYGAWRGKRLVNRFEDLRKAAVELDVADFDDLPMFRGKAVNGPQAALAFRIAATDDRLWDLTQRAVNADPVAWAEIGRLQHTVPDELKAFSDADTRTYLDAIEATKTKMARLEEEVADLEKVIARREETGPQPLHRGRPGGVNPGFFRYHTWELDRDLEGKLRDLEEVTRTLDGHKDYGDWLRSLPATYGDEFTGTAVSIEQVSSASSRFRALRQNTYHASPYSKAHTVTGIARATYVREANPIDLHRVDSGIRSIRRQFEQYQHLFNYVPDRQILNDVLDRYTRAPDEQARRLIAQEVETTHGLAALAHAHPELSEETIDAFLRQSRLRVDDMYDRLLSGSDSVYTTVPREDGTVDVNIMDGDRKITANLPVDVTQLPNFYTPMDIRRVHLAIKRDPKLFAEVDTAAKNFGRRYAGKAMEDIDRYGTAFNSVWKPLQLFRLAWPQRVLMDESFRAMAQLGATGWAREFFPAALTATGNAVKKTVLAPAAFVQRNKVKIGPGPLADEALGKTYSLEHELEVREAPYVPSYFTPKRNERRGEAIDAMVVENRRKRALRIKAAAIDRDVAAGKTIGKNVTGITDVRLGYSDPINTALMDFSVEQATAAFDPVTGKRVRQGFVVPVISKPLRLDPGELQKPGSGPAALNLNHDLNDFIEANAELLSSGGYRVMFTSNKGKIEAHVARVFRSTETDKATEFAQHVNADTVFNASKNYEEYVRSWGEQSPIMEALERQFVQYEKTAFRPGTSPAQGVGPVFHGAASELPEDLLPRDQVPAMRGNMVGQGFYTTTSRRIAEQYGRTGLYTIRGSKDGKRYQVFDVDDLIPDADRDDLIGYMQDYYRQFIDDGDVYDADVDAAYDLIGTSDTWLQAFQQLDWWHVSGHRSIKDPQRLLTEYLVEKKGAGALTHEGGRIMGDEVHQVYIWLNPENLKVRPAYERTGKYHLLEEWFSNPDSIENLVPENRIRRVGPKPRALSRADQERAAALSADFRNTERRELDEVFDEIEFDREIDSVHDSFARRLLKRKQFGSGYITLRDHEGNKVRTQRMFEGAGENYLPLVSSSPAFSRLTDTYHRTLSRLRSKAVGHKRILPPSASAESMATAGGRQAAREYYTAWADLINDQVRNSPIWFKMLDGETDEQIVNWLRSSHAGAALRQKLPHKGHNPERWVEEHRQALDFYVPNEELQQMLRQGKLQPSQLRRVEADLRPEVFGPDLDMIAGDKGFGAEIGSLTGTIYHALGTVPTDLLVRQPFAAGMYRLKMNNLLAAADPDQLSNAVLRGYEKTAREFALRQVRRTLFDLSDDSNFTQAIRFLAPFWGAQEEALKKWLGIAVERPETVARFYVGVDAIYNNFTIIDEDGNRVKAPGNALGYDANHRIVMQIPKQLKKLPWFKDVLKFQDAADFAFGSVNTALQGDQPFLPSVGPVVVFPANLLLNMKEDHGVTDDDEAWYRWLFPVGRPSGGFKGLMEQMFPGWARRGVQMAEEERSLQYANAWFSMYREMELDHKKRGLPAPSPKEVTAAVKSMYRLRMIASFGLPVPLNFRTKNQFFLDEYHKMQQTYGPSEAFERFVAKYGVDMARFTASSSESTVGVPPTAAGMADWMKNDELFAKHGEDWGTAMISPDAWEDDFSSDAYKAQFDIRVGEGSSKTLREMRDPAARLADVDTRTGWLEFRQFNSAISAELYSRGLTSLEQTGAEDLAQMKSQFVQDLETRNPAWSRDYRTFEDTIYHRISGLKEWAQDPRFDNRPDIQGVRQYLVIRDAAAQSLDTYAATTGGSRSLQANENSALRAWFYQQVGALIQANPAFGEFYSRYLDSDRLVRGSGP